MRKQLQGHFSLLIFSFGIIFFVGCKKSGNSPTNTSTGTRAPQQNKIIFFNHPTSLNTYEIWLANYDGSGAAQINIALPTNVKLSGNTTPKISLDGKKIYFNANLTDGGYNILGSNIYSCNLDGSNVQELISGGGSTIGLPAITDTYFAGQQGKLLYAEIANFAEDIYTANLDGSGQQKINVILPPNAYIPNGSPVIVSQDGQTIFFTASVTNGFYYIYSCSINGGAINLITTNTKDYQFIMGNTYNLAQQGKIVYNDYKGSDEILTANLDGTNAQEVNILIPSGVNQIYMDETPIKISPDGKTLFFNTITLNYNDSGLYSCNIDGSNVKQIVAPTSGANQLIVGEAF